MRYYIRGQALLELLLCLPVLLLLTTVLLSLERAATHRFLIDTLTYNWLLRGQQRPPAPASLQPLKVASTHRPLHGLLPLFKNQLSLQADTNVTAFDDQTGREQSLFSGRIESSLTTLAPADEDQAALYGALAVAGGLDELAQVVAAALQLPGL